MLHPGAIAQTEKKQDVYYVCRSKTLVKSMLYMKKYIFYQFISKKIYRFIDIVFVNFYYLDNINQVIFCKFILIFRNKEFTTVAVSFNIDKK